MLDACGDNCPFEPALIDPNEPGTEVTCDDLVDNDCDGLTDEADPDCQGACCASTCDGGSDCGAFQFCGLLGAACFCVETTEGDVTCIDGIKQGCGAACAVSSDCAAGSVCAVLPGCCGAPTCVIDQCPISSARSDRDDSASLFSIADEAFGAGFEDAGAIGMRGVGNPCSVVGEQTCASLFGSFSGIG